MILLSNRAALYARFSSDNQRTESIDAQLRAMQAYCEQHHFTIVNTYVDEAKSATNDRRPSFQQMISDSARKSFNIVLVHKLDRFARNRYDSAIYKRELKKNGVTVYSVLENLDSSPESIIMESVLEGMSEYYSQNLAREVMKGLTENALQCKHNGGKPPLGYDVDPVTKKLIVNEAEAETVRLIFRMYAEGSGYTEILNTLHEKHRKTKTGSDFRKNSLNSILTNQKYTGTYIFNRSSAKAPDGTRNSHRHKTPENIIAVDGGCPQIVETEIFNMVSARMNSHRRDGGRRNAKHVYLFSGKVYCKECGKAMVGNARRAGRDGHLYITYRCPSQKYACQNKEISRDHLERYVIALMEKEIFSKAAIKNIAKRIRAEQEEVNQSCIDHRQEVMTKLTQVTNEMENIADAIGKGLISPVLVSRLTTLEEERGKLEAELATAESGKSTDNIDPDLIWGQYKELRRSPYSPEYRAFLGEFLGGIVVGRYAVSISLRIGLGLFPKLDMVTEARRQEIYQH